MFRRKAYYESVDSLLMSETIVVTPDETPAEVVQEPVADVAFAAGVATAEVAQLSEEVAAQEVSSEIAVIQSEAALEVAAESFTNAERIEERLGGMEAAITRLAEITAQNASVSAAFLEHIVNANQPPKKKDTAPKRKSKMHERFYGGRH